MAVFVGAFIINNTFSILVAQRTVGANGRQIVASVLAESVVIAVTASAAGIAVGLAVARGLHALLGQFGLSCRPDSSSCVLGRSSFR